MNYIENKRKKRAMEEIKRIIVSRTDKIGDLVLSIPSFYMLKKMYPKAELIVLVRKYNYDIVKNLPYIDRVFKIDDFKKEELLTKIAYFKADAFIALYHDEYIAKLVKASKARIRIGPLSKPSSWLLYNKGVLQKRSLSTKNEAEYNLDLVKKLNVMRYNATYELNTDLVLGEENRKVADLFWEQKKIQGKVLVCNPFLGGSAKNIRSGEYARILERLLEEREDVDVILTCQIQDEEQALELQENIVEKYRERLHIFANGASILNVAAIIEKGDLYFGASTGPTHIAGALGKNIVAIYPKKKSQSPVRWGIYRKYLENVRYFIPDADGAGENYQLDYFESMDWKKEEEILRLLKEALL